MEYFLSAWIFFPLDKWYYLLVVPTIIFSLLAQSMVRSSFSKYSRIRSKKGISGSAVAQDILRAYGIANVSLERISGNLTDHYSPKEEVLRLSESVYDSTSIAALGVAAHEAGHAIQYAQAYMPVKIRTAIYPLANIGSGAGPYLALLGLIMQQDILFTLGIIFFAVAVLFYLLTLPVELDASRRALAVLEEGAYLEREELAAAAKVLRAAALTYVASAATAFASLLRLILLRNSRRN